MKKSTIGISMLAMMMVMLTSCVSVGGVFKAGVWTTIIVIVLIVLIVLFIIRKFSGGKNQ